jgi:hypothetical protein
MLIFAPPDTGLIAAVRDRLERVWMPGDWFQLTDQVARHYAWKAAIYGSMATKGYAPPLIEIGSRAGYSMHAFDVAADRSDARVERTICFDGGLDEDSPACLANFRKTTYGWAIDADLVVVNTRNVSAVPPRRFAHVDADHTRAGCLHDLELVHASEVILADDCDNAEVKAAVMDFLDNHGDRSVQFVNDGLRTFGVISWRSPT